MKPDEAIVADPATLARHSRLRRTFVLLEVAAVLILIAVWASSPAIRQSRSLWVLFFYSFPSQFLVAILPLEPVFLYFSKFHPTLAVCAAAMAGTLLIECINYTVFQFVTDLSFMRKFSTNSLIQRIIRLFDRAPFVALIVAGFSPIPFHPFRFLVVLARYPLAKYLLAIFISRTPRLFILAAAGNHLKVLDVWIAILLVAMMCIIYFPFVKTYIGAKIRGARGV